MKLLKVIDLLVVGLFIIGLLVGYKQIIQAETTPEDIVADVSPNL